MVAWLEFGDWATDKVLQSLTGMEDFTYSLFLLQLHSPLMPCEAKVGWSWKVFELCRRREVHKMGSQWSYAS